MGNVDRTETKTKGEAGSTTIEAIAALSAFCLVIALGLSVAYLSFARVWIERSSYETLVCLSTSTSTAQCERTFRQDVESALPIGKVSLLNSVKSSREGSIRVRFEINGREVIRHSMRLRYPLTAASPERRSKRTSL